MRRRISIWGCVRPSVGPSVRRSVPCYFRRWKVRILGASCAVYPALFRQMQLDWANVTGRSQAQRRPHPLGTQTQWQPHLLRTQTQRELHPLGTQTAAAASAGATQEARSKRRCSIDLCGDDSAFFTYMWSVNWGRNDRRRWVRWWEGRTNCWSVIYMHCFLCFRLWLPCLALDVSDRRSEFTLCTLAFEQKQSKWRIIFIPINFVSRKFDFE